MLASNHTPAGPGLRGRHPRQARFVIGAAAVLLLSGAYSVPLHARTAQLVAWAFLAQVAAAAGLRRLRRDPNDGAAPLRFHAEEGALFSVAALACAQATGGLGSAAYALLYLLGAAFVLAHPLPLALGLIGFALLLDGALFGISGALPAGGLLLAAHAGF